MPSLLSQFLTEDFDARLRGLPMDTTERAAQPMTLTPVTSTYLAAYGYDRATHALRVQFVSGHIQEYAVVLPETWAAFQAAPSKGRFYGREIKGKYPTEKVTGECPNCGDIGLLAATCGDCGTGAYRAPAFQVAR